MRFFLFLSLIPVFLTAGMAWLTKCSTGYPEQKVVGEVLWLFIGLTAFALLKAGGLSTVLAITTVGLVSAVGFFFDTILSMVFKDPGLFPKAPPE